ncbi:MAG: hypothetical protein ACTIJ9_17220 [Aequorivita sp.]
MKKTRILLLLLFLAHFGFAQVGIGTTSPTPGFSLDVDGALLVQEEFKLGNLQIGAPQYDNYNFLLRRLDFSPEGEVAKLNLQEVTVAPINIFNYTFHNLRRDDVTWVDLQFDATKYIVGLSNFQYEGQAIQKGSDGANYTYIGNFVSRTYVKDGTWHIEMRNRSRNAASNNAITYKVTLIVYDKNHFKELPSISVEFAGENEAEAVSPTGL